MPGSARRCGGAADLQSVFWPPRWRAWFSCGGPAPSPTADAARRGRPSLAVFMSLVHARAASSRKPPPAMRELASGHKALAFTREISTNLYHHTSFGKYIAETTPAKQRLLPIASSNTSYQGCYSQSVAAQRCRTTPATSPSTRAGRRCSRRRRLWMSEVPELEADGSLPDALHIPLRMGDAPGAWVAAATARLPDKNAPNVFLCCGRSVRRAAGARGAGYTNAKNAGGFLSSATRGAARGRRWRCACFPTRDLAARGPRRRSASTLRPILALPVALRPSLGLVPFLRCSQSDGVVHLRAPWKCG